MSSHISWCLPRDLEEFLLISAVCCVWRDLPTSLPRWGLSSRLIEVDIPIIPKEEAPGRRDSAHQSDELRRIPSLKRRCLCRSITATNILPFFSFSFEQNDKLVGLVIGSASAVVTLLLASLSHVGAGKHVRNSVKIPECSTLVRQCRDPGCVSRLTSWLSGFGANSPPLIRLRMSY